MQAFLASGITSETTLAFLALDRALKICQSAWSLRIPKSGLVIIILWIYSFLVSCPPLFGWGEFVQEGPGIRYTLKKEKDHIFIILLNHLYRQLLCWLAIYILEFYVVYHFPFYHGLPRSNFRYVDLISAHLLNHSPGLLIYRAIFLDQAFHPTVITVILVWHDRSHQHKAIDNDVQQPKEPRDE